MTIASLFKLDVVVLPCDFPTTRFALIHMIVYYQRKTMITPVTCQKNGKWRISTSCSVVLEEQNLPTDHSHPFRKNCSSSTGIESQSPRLLLHSQSTARTESGRLETVLILYDIRIWRSFPITNLRVKAQYRRLFIALKRWITANSEPPKPIFTSVWSGALRLPIAYT